MIAVLLGILAGIMAGSIVGLFRLLVEKAEFFRHWVYEMLAGGSGGGVLLWLVSLLITALVLAALVKKEPLLCGSGIPQVKGVLAGNFIMSGWRVLVGKFVGVLLATGAGLSVGRAGPSVQLGAIAGQEVGRFLHRPEQEIKLLMSSGAGAGLAAIFNAPLAGTLFSLEEFHRPLSPAALLSALAASLTASLVAQNLFAPGALLPFESYPTFPPERYDQLLLLGLLAGALGSLFTYALVWGTGKYRQVQWLPAKFKFSLVLLAGGLLGFAFPSVQGDGHDLLLLLERHPGLDILLFLYFLKFAFTLVSCSTGIPGGIIFPLLALGALVGNCYGLAAAQLLHLPSVYVEDCIVLGMVGFFAAIIKTPLTAILLCTEITGSLANIPAFCVVSLTAYYTANWCKAKPIFDALLEQSLSKEQSPTAKKNTGFLSQ